MAKTCSTEGCERPVRARGMCVTCYNQWRRDGGEVRTVEKASHCQMPGCMNQVYARNLCKMHHMRMLRAKWRGSKKHR
jgi:hypothetical protein